MRSLRLESALLVALLIGACQCGEGFPVHPDPSEDAGASSDAGGNNVDPDAGQTLHQLTVTVSGPGAGSISSIPAGISACASAGGTCTASFAEGTAVTLRATSERGDFFTGWIGGPCSGVGKCDVTLDADAAVEAAFVKLLYFSSQPVDGGGLPDNLWTSHGDGSDPAPLTRYSRYAPAAWAEWSPDGQHVLLLQREVADGGEEQNLVRVPAGGGPPERLTHFLFADHVQEFQPLPSGRVILSVNEEVGANIYHPAVYALETDGTVRELLAFEEEWSFTQGLTADESVAYLRDNSRRFFWRIPLDGGAVTQFAGLDAGVWHSAAVPSPDGTRFAAVGEHGIDPGSSAANVWMIPPDGGAPTRSTDLVSDDCYDPPVWLDSQRLVVLCNRAVDGGAGTGQLNLFRLTVDTGVLEPMTRFVDSDPWAPRASPDRSAVVFDLRGVPDGGLERRTQIWRLDPLDGGVSPIIVETEFSVGNTKGY